MSISSISPIDKTLSGAASPGQSGPGSDGSEGVLIIPQMFKTGASPSDCLMSYPGHSWEGAYFPAKIQSVYYTAISSRQNCILLIWCKVTQAYFLNVFHVLRWIFNLGKKKKSHRTRLGKNTYYSDVCTILRIVLVESFVYFFIIKGFRTIVFIVIVISPTFRPMCPPDFFRCLSNSGTFTKLWTTSSIETTGVVCSDSVSRNRVQVLSIPVLLLACSEDWTCNLQMIYLLRSLGS